ncbi:acyl-CoA dehydrogenase family protein [Microbacterium sp.]|uniref:acyl-CoA dehydrogenase family protein n=1 Tax=Microbacterium sp. TaxID=51671 RepID=UPI0037C64F34
MNTRLSDEAIEVGKVVSESIAAAGGLDLLRRAVAEPSVREEAGGLLAGIGVWELDPLADRVELEVAASVCRAAGHFAVPYPVAERLGRRGDAGASMLVAQTAPRVAMHADLDLEWSAIDLCGQTYRVVAVAPELIGSHLAPFGARVDVASEGSADPLGAALLVTLQSWWLLGLLEHAMTDTVQYTREREQFGSPLIRFQAVGFGLADMSVATTSLAELAKYTLWSVGQRDGAESALTDALGLRAAALSAADVVLRGAHQFHGAMGFTDEVGVSWLSRASHAVRRLPEGEHRTRGLLTELIERHGWEPYGRVRSVAPVADRVT